MPHFGWQGTGNFERKTYLCPYCGNQVGAREGYGAAEGPRIYICPICTEPTYFAGEKQIPGTPFGDAVSDLPADVDALYLEARNSMAVSAHTGAVMLCRKILMNVAVAEKAAAGLSFADYVTHLASQGYVPPKGKEWVDHIRRKGNEANHEIALMRREDAEEIILFTGMLLKFMYELPARRPTKT